MESKEVKQLLVDTIKKNIKPYHFNAGSTEIIIRCPYCGDSSKSSQHTHLYIGLSDSHGIPYYCQKCTTSDFVDSSFLKDIGIYDSELLIQCDKLKKEYKKRKKTHKVSSNELKSRIIQPTKKNNSEEKELIIPKFRKTKTNKAKYKYINSRYSFDLTPEEYVEKYKVIFSLRDFIIQNDLEVTNLSDYMLENLMENYIGFLSSDKSYIIFRNIQPNCAKNKRYYMFDIFDSKIGKRFYTASSSVDLTATKIKLVIAEGPFDIIGIREYFYKNNDKNTIFVSVNGKGYNLVINYFVRLGFMDMDIDIYSDKDVKLDMYKNFKRTLPALANNRVRVFYNTIDKDTGTTIDKIKLKSSIL